MKDRNHMITSREAEKSLFKNPTISGDKYTQQTRNRRKLPQSIKGHYEKSIANTILNSKRLFSL